VAGSVVPAERLRAPGLDAADVLRGQPGVSVVETGGYGAMSTASVRGATAAQTPVYLGGVRLNDDVGGTADLSLVPLWLIHRVEIYRSNAPVEADQLGIGGAIFFEPRRPGKPEAGAGALLGSFGHRGAWAFGDIGDRRSAVVLGVRHEAADNDYAFVHDGGTRFVDDDRVERRRNADASTLDMWALGRTQLRGGTFDVLWSGVSRDMGVAGLSLFVTERSRVRYTRRLGAVSARLPCGSRCWITATSAGIRSETDIDDPLREIALGTTHLTVRGARVEPQVIARVGLSERVTIAPAMRAAVETLAIDALRLPPVRGERLFGRGSFSGEWRAADRLTVRALGSFEAHGTGPVTQTQPAGRVGVQYGEDVALLANVGRYARVPTLGELYGISGVVRGNDELRPEQGVTADLGVRASFERGAIDAFVFARSASDLVSYVRAAQGYVVPFNVGSARVLGSELAAWVSPWSWLRCELAATLLDPRDTTGTLANDVLPHLSRLVVVPRIEARSKHLVGRVSYIHQSSRYADRAGLVVIPEQGSLDVDLELHLPHTIVRARLTDALDQIRFDQVGYPLPGRSGHIALEVRAP
jgi:iron complex outermembrane receptor protein